LINAFASSIVLIDASVAVRPARHAGGHSDAHMALTALRLPRKGVRRKHLVLPLGLNQKGGQGGDQDHDKLKVPVETEP